MHAFSAADLISPAIKRTRWFLFQPFRWTTYLKLCLVAVLTEGGFGGNFNVPGCGHGGSASSPANIPSLHSPNFGISPFAIVVIAAIVVVLIGISFVIFYLVTRLRFALFYSLVYRTREIGPGWNAYESQSWRFFLFSIAVGFVFLIALAVIAIPFLLGFYRIVVSTQAGEPLNWAGLFALLLPLIPIFLLVVLLVIALHIILHDLMLPHVALENLTIGEAWKQVRMRIGSEKGTFALYALLRILLPFAAGVAALIAMLIPGIILVVLFAIPAAGLAALTAAAAGLARVLLMVVIAAIVLIGIAALFVLIVSVSGPIGIWSRNFALLFYGGRYQVLGNLIDPPPAQVPAPQQ